MLQTKKTTMAPKRRKSRKSSSRSSRKKARKRHSSPKGRSRFGNVIDVDGSNHTENMTLQTFVDIVRQMAIQSIEHIGQERAEKMYNSVVECSYQLKKLYVELEDLIAKEAFMNLSDTGDEEEMNLFDKEIKSKQDEINKTKENIRTVVLNLDGLLRQDTSAQEMFQQWVNESLPSALRNTNAPGLTEGIVGATRSRRPRKMYNV